MRNKHNWIMGIAAVLLVFLCALAADLFLLRPSGVYSHTRSGAYGFEIGMSREQAFNQIASGRPAISQLRTREPFHMQDPHQAATFRFTPELQESNYWVLYPSNSSTYLLLFRDGAVCRILRHVRRFGELETGLSLFSASYPIRGTTATVEDKDLFSGMSPDQVDALVQQQQQFTKVFLD